LDKVLIIKNNLIYESSQKCLMQSNMLQTLIGIMSCNQNDNNKRNQNNNFIITISKFKISTQVFKLLTCFKNIQANI